MADSPLYALPATELSRLLAAGELGSEQLVRALLDRIEEVDGRVHAFTQVFRESAVEDARHADAERRAGRARGPLHGLPVSLKESLDVAGQVTTLGMAGRKDRRAVHDAAIVAALREAGAVLLGRTNLSQTLLFSESRNPLFGMTANPFSLAHSPGGSSGGEAAALAAGMSCLGIGSDVGGSIRSPASHSGVCGLMPTLDRWPMRGAATGIGGQEAVRSQVGPLARTVGDLALVMSALDPARLSALDPRCPPVPWSGPESVNVRALRIGFIEDDGSLPPSPAIRRALLRGTELLRDAGCEVMPFPLPDASEARRAYFGVMSADGGQTLSAQLSGGEVEPAIKSLLRIAALPALARAALARAMRLANEPRVADLVDCVGEKPVREFWRLTALLRDYRRKMLEAFDAARVDAVLCPAFATPALPHGMARDFSLAISYSALWNAVHFPAGTVPITRVREDETRGRHERDRLERHAAQVDRASAGLPVGIQVVARPWREGTLLAVMAALEAGARGDPEFPRTPVTPQG